MRLHVLSDLHIEQAHFTPPATDADVVVLAGDIGVGTAGVEWARERFADRPVLYLAGNHEFYGATLPGLIPRLRAAAAGSNVTVLENDELVLGGVRFLGATLWSDFEIAGADQRDFSMRVCARAVNDYRLIRWDGKGDGAGDGPAGDGAPGDRDRATGDDAGRAEPGERATERGEGAEDGTRPLTPGDTRTIHLASRAWLESALDRPFDGTTVVLSHHQPLARGEAPRSPVMRAIGGAFVSDLTALMGGERMALWIYGHTHRPADLDQAGTRLVSNPRGYPHELIEGFDPGFVAEV